MKNTKILKIGFDLDGVILLWLFFISRDAKLTLESLRDQGHVVKIVTARGIFTFWQAKLMLILYGLSWVEIVGVGRNGKKYKELEGFDLFIDNKIRHLIAIGDKVKSLYLFNKKPNATFKNLENWWQICFAIGFLEKGE